MFKKSWLAGLDPATRRGMKKQTQRKPTRGKFSLLRQLCNLIPNHLVPQLAREHAVEEKSRTFRPWSHVVSLLYAQLTHALGLNDVCDAFRFKRLIHVVDSTTIQLVARCMDWAKHRRRKAAAKCHVRLNLQTFLPRFAIVDTARHSDAKKAWELCAGLLAGEIVIFDKAYLDLLHLFELFKRGVSWVTRAKEGMQFRVVRRYQRGRIGNILRDDVVQMKSSASRRLYPAWLRRIVAMVEVDGKWREMEFLSDNLEWSAQTIVDL